MGPAILGERSALALLSDMLAVVSRLLLASLRGLCPAAAAAPAAATTATCRLRLAPPSTQLPSTSLQACWRLRGWR